MIFFMDEFYMRFALEQASIGSGLDEVPVGAVAVYSDKIIARAHNSVEKDCCATRHAEMICMEEASKILGNWRLTGVTLYTTLEPCSMCLGAILLSRIKRVVYGAPDLRHGGAGSWVNLLEKKHPTHTLEITRGILENESAHLLKTFFQRRRSAKLIRSTDRATERAAPKAR
jgi:tRNA(adenine34) deaminase